MTSEHVRIGAHDSPDDRWEAPSSHGGGAASRRAPSSCVRLFSSHHPDALSPADRDQRGRDLADPPLRRQHVELRRGVPRVQDLHPHAQAADVLLRLRAEGADLGAQAEEQ